MISPVDGVWHLVSVFMVFFLGFILTLRISSTLCVTIRKSVLVYVWHTLFCIIYMYYTLVYGGDSLRYYRYALYGDIEFYVGTRFIEYVAFTLVHYLGLSYLGLFLVFNVFGSLALVIFNGILTSLTKNCSLNLRRLALIAVLLPSASFWTSALGKDPISFFAIVLALWSSMDLTKRKLLMIISVSLMLLVRPHIAGIMIIALAGSLLFTRNVSIVQKFTLSFLIIPVALVLVPFAANYAGIENVGDMNEVESYVDSRQGKNLGGGSSLDIANMSPPLQVLTYLFRPLPFEAHNISALISSLDNTFLLFVFIYGIRYVRTKIKNRANHSFLWLYVIGVTLILASTTANLGIAVRQKWMIIPVLLYLLFAAISARQIIKKRRHNNAPNISIQ